MDGLQYSFGPFSLQADGTLLRNLAIVALPPRELSLLRALLAGAGQIVPADDLKSAAWENTHVSADSLPRCICSLRAHLNYEDSIQTIYKRGYRFNIPVKQAPANRAGEIWTERRATRGSGLPRLAILPFTTGSGVPEYFGLGIAEETMLRLRRLHASVVDVLAKDSICTLQERGVMPLGIGNALRADMLLMGTIQAMPQHFRLRAEMIRVVDSVQLWIEDFLIRRDLLSYADARLAKLVSARIRDTFATAIEPGKSGKLTHGISAFPGVAAFPEVSGLSLSASASGPAHSSTAAVSHSLNHSPVHSQAHSSGHASGHASTMAAPATEAQRSQAYAIYMQARAQWNSLERHLMQDAIRGFQQALELDPQMVSARVQLVHSYLVQSYFGYSRPDIAAELSRKHAETVLAQAPHATSVHSALGWIYFHHDRDVAAAVHAFSRPQAAGYKPTTIGYRIKFALAQGRFNAAIELLMGALEADPHSPSLHSKLAWALHLSGDSVAAVDQVRRTLTLFPQHHGSLFFGSMIFAATENNPQESRRELARKAVALASSLIQAAPSFDPAYAALAYAQARLGRIGEARAVLDRLQWLGRERYVLSSYQTPALVEIGDLDGAMHELTAAEQARCPALFEVLVDPRLQPLHDRPEYQRLMSYLEPIRGSDASVA